MRWQLVGFTYTAGLLLRPTRRRRSLRFGDRAERLGTWYAAMMGMKPSCCPERMSPGNTHTTTSPPEGDRLTSFGFTGWGVGPQPSIGATPDHRITAARLPPNRRRRPCRPGTQASPPTPPLLQARPHTALPQHRVQSTRCCRTAMPADAPRPQTSTDFARPVPHDWGYREPLTLPRSTTPVTTLDKDGRRLQRAQRPDTTRTATTCSSRLQ